MIAATIIGRWPIATFVRCLLCATIVQSLVGQSPLPPEYDRAKELFAKFSDVDDFGHKEDRVRSELIAIGPAVVPAMQRLFHESQKDLHRSRIISVLSSIDGGRGLIDLVNEQLSQPQNRWENPRWVFTALNNLSQIDPITTRRLAIRALDIDNSLVQGCALYQLETFGRVEDVDALRHFRAKRPPRPRSLDEPIDNLGVRADLAIETIERRAMSGAKVTVAAGETAATGSSQPGTPSLGANQAKATVPHDEAGWWNTWLVVIGAVTLVVAAVFLRRRPR